MKGTWKPNAHGLELANQLRQLREEAGLTQKQVGEHLGGSASQVRRMEQGRLPWRDELDAMLELYEVAADDRAPYFEKLGLAWQPGRLTRRKRTEDTKS